MLGKCSGYIPSEILHSIVNKLRVLYKSEKNQIKVICGHFHLDAARVLVSLIQ